MHENGVRSSLCKERRIHLVACECCFACGQFFFLTHAGPHVRINRLRARHCFLRRITNFNLAACFARGALRFRYHNRIRIVTWGRGDAKVRAGASPDAQERMADIIPVANVSDLQSAQAAEPLLESEEIGQRLAGMVAVRERVNHRDACVFSESINRFLREGTRDDSLNPALEIFRYVGNGFALAQF